MSRKCRKISDMTLELDHFTVAERMRHATKSGKKASFIILGGLDVGNVVRLTEPVMDIGRDSTCGIILKDDGISRRHAEVRRVGEDCILIKDLGSTNGTFVGGKRIPDALLRDGDKVLLGRRTVLKFVFQDALEDSYQRQIYESTTRDGLTGIFNRKYFNEKIYTDISFARRHHLSFTLLMMDIDKFKPINDTYGHRTGDKVLIAVTDVVADTIRTEDVLARYGGEEFAVIAMGTDLEGGRVLAERIRSRISKTTIRAENQDRDKIRVTISIGIASVPPNTAIESETLIAAADKNLYAAKEGGRDKVVASEIGGTARLNLEE